MNAPFTAAELQQLLARPVRAVVGREERAAFRDRHVLVTGAGGSIGAELARELAACRPALLGLVDHSELALFSIERELRQRWPGVRLNVSLTDVTRGPAIHRVCRDVRPDVVYHAAAYKHVTMAERAPAAAALVNVIGTVETAEAAAADGARFVLISSDKAADPKSVMGATKRLAEGRRARHGHARLPARRRALRQRARQQRERAPDHARVRAERPSRFR